MQMPPSQFHAYLQVVPKSYIFTALLLLAARLQRSEVFAQAVVYLERDLGSEAVAAAMLEALASGVFSDEEWAWVEAELTLQHADQS